jgi:hypothetical protein
MKNQNRWESLFEDFLEVTEFTLIKHTDGWGVYDRQGGNLGNIEGDRFEDAQDIFDRMDVYIIDYLYHDLEEELEAYEVNMKGREIPESAQDWLDLRKDEEFCNKNQEYIDNHAFEFNVLDMIANHTNEINLENVYYKSEEE